MRTHERNNYVILLSGIAVAAILMTYPLMGFAQIIYLQQQQTALAATTVTTKTTNDLSKASNNVTVQQGTISSGPPMGPKDAMRIAMILPPRADDSIYTGTLTYTASKKVDIFVIHTFGINNSSLVNSTYGEPANFPVGPGIQVAASIIEPIYGNSFVPSASIPFSGNALGFITFNSQPFIVTYSLKAVLDKPTMINNFTNALIKAPTPAAGLKVSLVPNAGALGDKAFSPNPIEIKAGNSVTWTNNDSGSHTVTSGSGANDTNLGKQFDSGLIGPKQSFTQTFKSTGEFSYFCQIHPTMVGKISVK
jgi:plastocyanin